ncbi:MAG: hypothetical protein RL328_1419, partial [Acidobacteriota bacterium]
MRRLALISAMAAVALVPSYAQKDSKYSSKLAPYVASPSRVVELMLDMAKVKPGDTV